MRSIVFAMIMLCAPYVMWAQSENYDKPPVFPDCEQEAFDNLKTCFDNTIYKHVFNTFKVPDVVTEENYKGDVVVLFEVNKDGEFRVVYVDATYKELKDEAKKVFDELPKISPATYNGRPTFRQYSIAIKIPLQDQSISNTTELSKETSNQNVLEAKAKTEFDSITKAQRWKTDKEFTRALNVPFSHQYYAQFDRAFNVVGTNSHTASKPYLYNEVANYYDLKQSVDTLRKDVSSVWGRKLWNERLVQLQGKDYWFTADPIFDLQVGKDTEADFSSTFNNTRGINIQGGLGKLINFSTSFFESQGRFADYVNRYAEQIRPASSDVAIIPGRGIAKRFKTTSYDYPIAEAYLSITPLKFLNVQFGYGKSFIGDGYRSLFWSDVASPRTFLKINTKFWKIKYTNTWTWLKDVRPDVATDGAYLNKYIANHFLSWNVTKRFNLGFFESVIWAKNDSRDFDVNYLNPIIFYRAIEFETGQDAGNALIGFSGKYKWNDNIYLYGQYIIDEFSSKDIFGGDKSWKNKLGFQLGAKYFNAFKVDNLMLQLEYNQVRPYAYSHNTVTLNFAHNNQSMAHLWGANFRELIAIGRYRYKRWFGDVKAIVGERGFDFNTVANPFAYGGDIFTSETARPFENGVKIGQGNKATTILLDVQAGYLINPATNLKLFANVTYRNFNPEAETATVLNSNTVWFNIGLRTDLFNWYFDF